MRKCSAGLQRCRWKAPTWTPGSPEGLRYTDSMTAWLLWVLLASIGAVQDAVRFHHVHYRVGDPSAAMNHVVSRVDGTRVMVPGLGVGVRSGTEFLLFDRLDPSDQPEVRQPKLPDAYRAAVSWFSRHGIVASPDSFASLQVAAGIVDERYDHLAFVAQDLQRLAEKITRAGTASIRSTGDAVVFDAGGGLFIELVRDLDRPDAFWCPMHPDVRSADRGACHLCGMDLVPMLTPKIGEYGLDVKQVRTGGTPGLSGLRLSITEPGSDERVKTFVTVHERSLHLFIVGRDLEYFEHVHPELTADGTFVLTQTIPPGDYMVLADFLPAGGTTQMLQRALMVAGPPRKPAPAVPSSDVRISLKSEDFVAGKYACLTFTVTDAKTGEPVTDLEPYLGAPAHMLIVRADLSDAVHVHPEELVAGGPAISFHPLVPAVGDYKAWIQIQRRGKVITVPFALRAER